ncbi:MAG TPA: DUF456 domain-containing protein [Candidatus Omnitrophica bacterium]|nr:DUF456 domain-containing protein [Candidatus Omnitrophota bacterium]
MEILGFILFVLFAIAGIILIFLGMAGTISIFLGSVIYAAFTHFDKVTWRLLLFFLFLVIAGELAENVLSMLGAKKFGASGKSSLAVLIGGLIGGIAGGLFSPIVGSIFGVLIGGCIAPIIAEYSGRKEWLPSLKAGLGALVGRVGGTLLKLALAGIMIVVTLVCIFPFG